MNKQSGDGAINNEKNKTGTVRQVKNRFYFKSNGEMITPFLLLT